MLKFAPALLLLLFAAPATALAEDKPDLAVVHRIKEQALRNVPSAEESRRIKDEARRVADEARQSRDEQRRAVDAKRKGAAKKTEKK